jgi:hypothetical protein
MDYVHYMADFLIPRAVASVQLFNQLFLTNWLKTYVLCSELCVKI